MKNEIISMAHAKCRCQYHVVFELQYRRKGIYKELSADRGQNIRISCEEKETEIMETQACVDDI